MNKQKIFVAFIRELAKALVLIHCWVVACLFLTYNDLIVAANITFYSGAVYGILSIIIPLGWFMSNVSSREGSQ